MARAGWSRRRPATAGRTTLKTFARGAAVVAFALCFLEGCWILRHCDCSSKDDAAWIGIGLYFLGKAVFVGPMLLLAAEQLLRKPAA